MKRLQPYLIAAMMICLSVPLIVMGEVLFQEWRGGYILLAVLVTVLEGIWSKRIYQRERLSGAPLVWRLVTEAMVLILMTKLLSYVGKGFHLFPDDLKRWIQEPATFFSMELVLVGLYIIGVWFIGQLLQSSLDQIDDPFERGPERQLARGQIRGFILSGGFWLLSLSGLIFGLPDLNLSLSNRDLNAVQLAVICYLGLSLLLLAHVQYLRRKIEWQLEGLAVPALVTRRWVRWGFLLTAGIFLIAVFLPAAYSLGPSQLLQWLLTLLYFFGQLIAFFVSLLISPLVWLLSRFGGEESVISQPQIDFPVLPEPSVTHIPVWWQYMRHVLQVVFVFIVLGVIFYTYAKNREFKISWKGDVSTRLMQLFRKIWAWFQSLRAGARLRLRVFRIARMPLSPVQERAQMRFPLMRARTPRARVRRYYLALLRRTAEFGLQRDPQQTPREYETELASKLPEGQIDLATLTDAFVHARYDAKEVSTENVSKVRKAWQMIRNTLRNFGFQER
jgi:hypothetical protein